MSVEVSNYKEAFDALALRGPELHVVEDSLLRQGIALDLQKLEARAEDVPRIVALMEQMPAIRALYLSKSHLGTAGLEGLCAYKGRTIRDLFLEDANLGVEEIPALIRLISVLYEHTYEKEEVGVRILDQMLTIHLKGNHFGLEGGKMLAEGLEKFWVSLRFGGDLKFDPNYLLESIEAYPDMMSLNLGDAAHTKKRLIGGFMTLLEGMTNPESKDCEGAFDEIGGFMKDAFSMVGENVMGMPPGSLKKEWEAKEKAGAKEDDEKVEQREEKTQSMDEKVDRFLSRTEEEQKDQISNLFRGALSIMRDGSEMSPEQREQNKDDLKDRTFDLMSTFFGLQENEFSA